MQINKTTNWTIGVILLRVVMLGIGALGGWVAIISIRYVHLLSSDQEFYIGLLLGLIGFGIAIVIYKFFRTNAERRILINSPKDLITFPVFRFFLLIFLFATGSIWAISLVGGSIILLLEKIPFK